MHDAILLDELDQAIHEFVGEVAELAQLFGMEGPKLIHPELPNQEIAVGELGDVIFTANWVMDLVDPSFFGQRGAVADGFLTDNQREGTARFGNKAVDAVGKTGLVALEKAPEELRSAIYGWASESHEILHGCLVNAGLLCNLFKKARWHRKQIDRQHVVDLVAQVLIGVDALILMCGFTIKTVVDFNIEKLDRRWPKGWQPGGGNR